jgi:hypothetical protein
VNEDLLKQGLQTPPEGGTPNITRAAPLAATIVAAILGRFARDDGDGGIFFLNGSDLLGPDWQESTVDRVHPNDLGFMRMAESLKPVLGNILTLP